MKNHLLLLGVILFAACNDFDESRGSDIGVTFVAQAEQAFPGLKKEIYETASGVILEKLDSIYILGGDVLLSQEQVAFLDNSQFVTRGAVLTDPTKFWPGSRGNLAYEFAPDFTFQTQVLQAMDSIANRTGVQFFLRYADTKDYVRFIHGDGNYSQLGRVGGKQNLSLDSSLPSGAVRGIAMHELCHALGLFHEQSRADRDNYVEILWDNIKDGKTHNFQTYIQDKTPGFDVGEFNFNSIMMYGSHDFGKEVNGETLETIRRKDGKHYYAQRSYLADTDVAAIRAIYNRPYYKRVVAIDVLREHEYYGDELYEEQRNTYISFYEDEACTKPTVLAIPRRVRVLKRAQYDSPDNPWQIQYYTVEIPAGSSGGYLGAGYYFMHEIQGGLNGYWQSELWIDELY